VFANNTFPLSDAMQLDFNGFGQDHHTYQRRNQFQRRVNIGPNNIFYGSTGPEYPYGLVLEYPVQAQVIGNKFFPSLSAAIFMRDCSGPFLSAWTVIANNVFDLSRSEFGVSCTDARCLNAIEVAGVLFVNNTIKVNCDLMPGFKNVVFLQGAAGFPCRDFVLKDNVIDDESTAGNADASRFLYLNGHCEDIEVAHNLIRTKKTDKAFIWSAGTSKRIRCHDNRLEMIWGKRPDATIIGRGHLQYTAGDEFVKDLIVEDIGPVAAASANAILTATALPATYAKTAYSSSYLALADFDDNLLRVTATGTIAVNDVLQDAAKTTEVVRVYDISAAPIYRVERAYAGSALVTHASGATWNLYGQVVAPTAQPDVSRGLSITGGQAGQNKTASILGRGCLGGPLVDSIIEDGTNTVDGFNHPCSYVDAILIPVRNTAGDTISVGTNRRLGLKRMFIDAADVIKIERAASAADVYTRETPPTCSTLYQNIPMAAITAGDCFKVHYRAVG
jgi:hypothetical protein